RCRDRRGAAGWFRGSAGGDRSRTRRPRASSSSANRQQPRAAPSSRRTVRPRHSRAGLRSSSFPASQRFVPGELNEWRLILPPGKNPQRAILRAAPRICTTAPLTEPSLVPREGRECATPSEDRADTRIMTPGTILQAARRETSSTLGAGLVLLGLAL